jgi:hypothetical protein
VISGFFGLEEERNRVRRDKYRGSMQAGILLGGIKIGDAESSKKKKKKKKKKGKKEKKRKKKKGSYPPVSSNWSIFLGP